MTNTHDLQNHMVGDPVDDRKALYTDYDGNVLYDNDDIWEIDIQGHTYHFLRSDADGMLEHFVNNRQVAFFIWGYILKEWGAQNSIEALFWDGGVEHPINLLSVLGATQVNDGEAA